MSYLIYHISYILIIMYTVYLIAHLSDPWLQIWVDETLPIQNVICTKIMVAPKWLLVAQLTPEHGWEHLQERLKHVFLHIFCQHFLHWHGFSDYWPTFRPLGKSSDGDTGILVRIIFKKPTSPCPSPTCPRMLSQASAKLKKGCKTMTRSASLFPSFSVYFSFSEFLTSCSFLFQFFFASNSNCHVHVIFKISALEVSQVTFQWNFKRFVSVSCEPNTKFKMSRVNNAVQKTRKIHTYSYKAQILHIQQNKGLAQQIKIETSHSEWHCPLDLDKLCQYYNNSLLH